MKWCSACGSVHTQRFNTSFLQTVRESKKNVTHHARRGTNDAHESKLQRAEATSISRYFEFTGSGPGLLAPNVGPQENGVPPNLIFRALGSGAEAFHHSVFSRPPLESATFQERQLVATSLEGVVVKPKAKRYRLVSPREKSREREGFANLENESLNHLELSTEIKRVTDILTLPTPATERVCMQDAGAPGHSILHELPDDNNLKKWQKNTFLCRTSVFAGLLGCCLQ